MNLQITIPQDSNNVDRNPNFKTPTELANGAESEFDDAESEMMVMQPSDSMSSMGSQMMRMDSAQQLSQTSSFNNIHEINKEAQNAKALAAGATGQFVAVTEEDESD